MKYILLFALLLLNFSFCFGQTKAVELYEITTNDGNQFIGHIVSENKEEILLRTFNYGDVSIKKFLISEQKTVKPPRSKSKKKENQLAKTKINEQNKDSIWRVVTKDGFDFNGTIPTFNADTIKLKTTKYGTLTLSKENISSIELVAQNQIINGDVWFENPQSTRYFYSPNGYGLKKGEGYYQNVWVLFNQVSYGFSDKFTMGFGTIPLFLFGVGVVPVWITPKLSFPIIENKLNISTGVFAGAVLGNSTAFALPYGTVTLGDRNKNTTMGIGYLATSSGGFGVLTGSTMIRATKKTYFLSENYLFIGEDAGILLLSAGGRTVWPKVSIDYGLFVPLGAELGQFVAIPWVGFVIPFSKEY